LLVGASEPLIGFSALAIRRISRIVATSHSSAQAS
jgi:hypothetical protein